MKPELEAKLAADYPEFFAGRAKPLTESRMSEGCSCDDGWYAIINDFCSLAKQALGNARVVRAQDGGVVPHEPPRLEFVQIKEKLGTLRLYYRLCQPEAPEDGKDSDDIHRRLLEITHEIRGYQAFASLLSGRTCEITGMPGELRQSGGVYKTLSQNQAEQLGFQTVALDDWLSHLRSRMG